MKLYNPLDHFEIRDNCICIANQTIVDLVKSGISTPAYIYSKDVITNKINLLRNTLPSSIQIYYSIKANPLKELVNFVNEYVDGLEVSSISELNTALQTGISNQNICFTGPGKSIEELEIAIANKIVISAESILELERIHEIGRQQNLKPSVLIRINPNFTQLRAGMKMASGSSPFGIDVEQMPELVEWIYSTSIDLNGFHIYSGSQILDADAINLSQTKTVQLVHELASYCQKPIKIINIGGGFGIPYFSKHTPLDLKTVSENLQNLLPTLEIESFKKPIQPIIELGRYIVGECGIYICKITDKKVSRGKIYLVTNGGMHHHLAASGNLGQKYRKNFPVHIANNINSAKKETVNIVGKLCTPLDILGENIETSEAKVGDYVAIMQSGAYGLSASPINFLGHPEPSEYFL